MENCKVPAIENNQNIKIKTEVGEHIFRSKEAMTDSITRLCYGNMYVIGRIWIEAMRKVLVGSKIPLLPVIEAKAQKQKEEEQVPQKPAKMSYEELSIYESPHYEYKKYQEDTTKCSVNSNRLLHSILLPHVTSFRKYTENNVKECKAVLKKKCEEVCGSIMKYKDECLGFARNPDNILIGRVAVVTAAVSGFILGKRMGKHGESYLRGIFWSTASVVAVGAVFFPKETDVNFREICQNIAKQSINLYNWYCSKGLSMSEKSPCAEELPEKSPDKKNKKDKNEESGCPEKDGKK